ncbi:GIY-YIG nuclease family protein [Ulvibacterium marinum]|uniref:Uncharacterized protein n=1 Tax=Ulvibacterium marinum TaxID=2419782 RepID=A0A3B0CAF3_9FLAO|nr:hypothetical protein [Ulvibacterium marinum]RKN79796.1 hypothetical protein D7Z94_16075 [Ulvibacterium marinum]
MVSKINAFTKSHAKYLGHVAFKKVKEIDRFETENSTTPIKSYITTPVGGFETGFVMMSEGLSGTKE